MLLLIGSANRDERRFADPDRFDIHRKIEQHLDVRPRHPLLPGRSARAARRPRRAGRGAEAIPDVGGRPRERGAGAHLDGARVGEATGERGLISTPTEHPIRRYPSRERPRTLSRACGRQGAPRQAHPRDPRGPVRPRDRALSSTSTGPCSRASPRPLHPRADHRAGRAGVTELTQTAARHALVRAAPHRLLGLRLGPHAAPARRRRGGARLARRAHVQRAPRRRSSRGARARAGAPPRATRSRWCRRRRAIQIDAARARSRHRARAVHAARGEERHAHRARDRPDLLRRGQGDRRAQSSATPRGIDLARATSTPTATRTCRSSRSSASRGRPTRRAGSPDRAQPRLARAPLHEPRHAGTLERRRAPRSRSARSSRRCCSGCRRRCSAGSWRRAINIAINHLGRARHRARRHRRRA